MDALTELGIEPMGVLPGGLPSFAVRDVLGQIRFYSVFSENMIRKMAAGNDELLARNFPVYRADGELLPRRFNVSAVASAIIRACYDKGLHQPTHSGGDC